MSESAQDVQDHRLGDLGDWIEVNHGYDVPELVALPVARRERRLPAVGHRRTR